MAQATSYTVVGDREDLTDLLTILEPEETPFLSMANKTKKPSNSYQEWQVDNLKAPAFDGVIEGTDVTTFENKSKNRARIGNYIEKQRESWAVSDIQEMSDPAGIANEVAQSKAKAARELKRSIESSLCSDKEMQQDNGTVPWLSRGLGLWINNGAQTVNPVPASYRTPSNSINATATASLTEANFNAVFQSIYEQTGSRKGLTLLAGTNLKAAVSNFQRVTGTSGTTKTYMVTQNADSNEISLKVDIYRGDYADVSLVPTMFNGRVTGGAVTAQVQARGYVIDPELVGVGYMKGIEAYELPNLGGGRRGVVESIYTLVIKNPLGLGKFAASS